METKIVINDTWSKEFDELFTNQTTERSLTIAEMEQKNTYYTKELIDQKQFIRRLLSSQAERVLACLPKEKEPSHTDYENEAYNKGIAELKAAIIRELNTGV